LLFTRAEFMETTTPVANVPASPEPSRPKASQPTGSERLQASLNDLMCHVTVRVGTGRITVRDCLALVPGRLLHLEQAAGEDLRVLVNGVLVAAGEVVVDEDRTMIRVTEVAPAFGLRY
jgi:flagellar motor switch protein FliN/FliY